MIGVMCWIVGVIFGHWLGTYRAALMLEDAFKKDGHG